MQAYGVFAGSVRRQAAVYAGLRRAQAAEIVGHDRRRARRNLRAYVRAQMEPRCAGVRTHKFQKPEKRLAAVVPRCAGVRIHKCRPRCMLRQAKHCAGLQRAKSGAIDVAAERFRWLAEVLKEALCRRPVYTNGRYPWASKPLRGPAAGESRRYQPSPAMIWTKLRIYERTGDCIRRLGAQTDAALSARLRRTSRREGLRACESRQYRSVVRK